MPNLVFLHGFLGVPNEFDFLIKSLKKNFNCISINLNKGNSFDLKSQAEFVKSKLDELGIKKAHFWGYSMGGRVLLEFYKHFHETCESLTVESTSLGLTDSKERKDRMESDSQWAELIQSNPDLFLEKWYSQELFKNFKKNFAKPKSFARLPLHAQMILEASPGANPDHFDVISNISIPVLALVGQFDDKYLQNWGKLIDKPTPITIEIIKNSGHVIHIENPTGALQAFKKFITETL